jgi:hypothetical protein
MQPRREALAVWSAVTRRSIMTTPFLFLPSGIQLSLNTLFTLSQHIPDTIKMQVPLIRLQCGKTASEPMKTNI